LEGIKELEVKREKRLKPREFGSVVPTSREKKSKRIFS